MTLSKLVGEEISRALVLLLQSWVVIVRTLRVEQLGKIILGVERRAWCALYIEV